MKGVIFTPYLSSMNYWVDPDVDQFINDIIDSQAPVLNVDEYNAVFHYHGKLVGVWTANQWYAYASQAHTMEPASWDEIQYIRDKQLYAGRRPRRKTMVKLDRYIKQSGKHAETTGKKIYRVLKSD